MAAPDNQADPIDEADLWRAFSRCFRVWEKGTAALNALAKLPSDTAKTAEEIQWTMRVAGAAMRGPMGVERPGEGLGVHRDDPGV